MTSLKMLPPMTKVDDADFRRTYRGVEVPPGTTIEDILRPGYWSHHADKIQKHDLIDIVSSDATLDVQVRVIEKKDGLITLRVLRQFQDDDAMARDMPQEPTELPDIPENYSVNHTPKTSWRVWSKVPSKELARDIKSKPDAIKWAIAHEARATGV